MASINEPIVIVEVLKEFIIADVGETVLLSCKLSREPVSEGVQWYKEYKIIEPSTNTTINKYDLWHVVMIKNICIEDAGIYTIVVKSTASTVYSKCRVYVKHKHDNETYNCIRPQNVHLIRNLRSCTVGEGDEMKLDVQFSTQFDACYWYRNDKMIDTSESHVLIKHSNENTTSQLTIMNATTSISGIYSVVAKTRGGAYLCSYADVLVASDYICSLFNNKTVPYIFKPIPRPPTTTNRIEAYVTDDVRIIYKANFDSNTTIEWTKQGVPVAGDRFTCETYDNYIALRLLNVKIYDTGEYSVLVRNKTWSIVDKFSTVLTVIDYCCPRPSPCAITSSLKPAIASVGNRVTFRCSFNIGDLKQVFVSWLIGRHTIKRSNSNFKVICNGDDFILHITAAVPEMSGKVECQLRQATSPTKSILITKTSSTLAIVPTPIIEEEKRLNQIIIGRNIYFDDNVKISIPGLIVREQTPSNDEIIMYLTFSKLSGGAGIFFDASNDSRKPDVDVVSVFKTANTSGEWTDWRIEWDRKLIQTKPKEWYYIDVIEKNRTYVYKGVSRSPKFDLSNPPSDKLIKFRIRTMKPNKSLAHSTFTFIAEELAMRNQNPIDVGSMQEFRLKYESEFKVGRGDFGVVNLTRNQNGKLFRAKNIKFDNRYKPADALKELEIMKILEHPNTVTLVDVFVLKNRLGVLFIIEYLWGGELLERTIEDGQLSEEDVIVYVRQILLALQYLHSKNIIYLDLKPDNIICVHPNNRIVKLVEYGMARFTQPPFVLPIEYATPQYMSPELLHGEFVGTYCDMWSLGVLTYWLLSGKMPFFGSWMVLRQSISNAQFNYDHPSFRLVSNRAKSFVNDLLQRKIGDRSTATRSLTDKWIVEGPGDVRPRELQETFYVNLPNHVKSKFKVVSIVALAVVRFRAGRR